MYDVITVGSSTVDVFAHTSFSELIKIQTPDGNRDLIAYPSGSKIIINKLEKSIGGGGTNTATTFARLGLKTGYIGKIGDDPQGEMITKFLKKEKIKFLGSYGNCSSGYSVILDSLENDRTILAFKGDNDNLNFKELDIKKIKTKWFYFCAMLNKSYETLLKIAEYADQNNIPFAFNPSNYLAKKGSDYLWPLISKSTVLIINTEEAELLTNTNDRVKQHKILTDIGAKYVGITNNKKGASISYKGTLHTAVPIKVKITETTGAGDAFASSFVAGLVKGKNLKTCIQYAFANASSVVGHMGSKNILMTTEQMATWLKDKKVKIQTKKI
ncbi:carbohydrate kinase family protein [Candidatus Woesearchaeota archaeon]|nr:carbohydrate kinase family protein [Candidatus Woesearchaeota archaeon]